jgi:CBS domain containing-hemolysin-like protein
MVTKIAIIVTLLIMAFVLSASEVAFYALTSSHESLGGKISMRFLKSPQLLLSTILVSNAVTVFLFSLYGASLAIDFASEFSLNKTIVVFAEVVIFSGLLILFADTVPKVVAFRKPRLVARVTLPLLVALLMVESPIVFPLNSFLIRINGRRKKSQITLDNDGLKRLSEIAASSGVMEENEARLLKKIAYLGEKTVSHAMTPRSEITSISVDSNFKEVLETLRRSEHSRLPVYSKSKDNVVGMLYARDFLRVFRVKSSHRKFRVDTLMRKSVFVPETQSLERLVETYRENRVRIAVVVDEFGGLAGIVTLSDVVREIFGSSAEGSKAGGRISVLPDRSFVVKGNARLDEIALEVDGFDLGRKSNETISSLLTEARGQVPRPGSRIVIGDFEFEVEQATPKSILQVKLRRLNPVPIG